MEETRRKFKVALFDMDGILYNSMPNHARAWHESMASYGIDMPEVEAYILEGMRGVDTIKLVAKRQWGRDVTDDEAQAMYRRKTEYFARIAGKHYAEIIPGVQELQRAMKSLGMYIGVVTGSGQPALLDRIRHDFDGLISPDIFVTALNIEHGKPAPDPYLKGMEMAASLLGEPVVPQETIVVENAPLGVKSGHAAGNFTVAVNTGPLPDEFLQKEGANVLFHSMEEFRNALDELIEGVREKNP